MPGLEFSQDPKAAELSEEEKKQDAVLMERIASELEALWAELSECISQIEAGLASTSATRLEANAAARVLPPGAAQVQPPLSNPF